MDGLVQLAQQYPHIAAYLAIAGWLYTLFVRVMSAVADSLDTPTNQDTRQYRFWFRMVNYCANNSKRASIPRIEDSPNFIPAAEAYMKQKLAEAQGQQGNLTGGTK